MLITKDQKTSSSAQVVSAQQISDKFHAASEVIPHTTENSVVWGVDLSERVSFLAVLKEQAIDRSSWSLSDEQVPCGCTFC